MFETNKKEKRTLMIVSLVLVLTLVLGISFAYFAAQGASAEQTITTATFGITFDDNSAIVNATNIKPLVREDALPVQDDTGKVTTVGKAVTKNFKITNTGDQKMYIHLTLDNMTLPDNLRRYDFVWSLYEVTDKANNIEKNVSNGTFLIEENNMDIAPYQVFEADETKEYNLYIWIEETHLNQSVMMGQTFKATITATGEDYWTSPENDFVVDENGVLTAYNGPGGDVIIPPVVNGVTVKKIGDYNNEKIPFENNSLSHVTIPSTVTTIDDLAFINNQLKSIFIPNSVTTIDGGAFQGNQLTFVSIPNSVTSRIYDITFGSSYLKTIFIPNSITEIGEYAFSECGLENIIIPNSVTDIGVEAFSYNQLTTAVIPSSVTFIAGEESDFGPFVYNDTLSQIIVLGKTEVPEEFESGWNFINYDDNGTGIEANIIFKP